MRRLYRGLAGVVFVLVWQGSARAQDPEVAELRKQVRTLKEMVAALEARLEAIEKRPAVKAAPPVAPAPGAALREVRETSRRDAETAARIDNRPLDPTLQGQIEIPGTSSTVKFGGYAKMDLLYDPSRAGNPDQFVPNTIPVGLPPGANHSNFTLHARQSRINVDFRRPGQLGNLRVFLEADFFGGEGATAFRMRHAYGQVKNLLLGWTWSTLSDVDAFPDTLDFAMTNGTTTTRQPQLRYTQPFGGGQSLAFAIEKPTAEINIAGVTNVTRYPDTIVRYRVEGGFGHLQLGGVFREIGGASVSANSSATVFGSGAMLNGSLRTWGRDAVVFGASYGRGLAHYVNNASGLGFDAAADVNARSLVALPSAASYAAYQHFWAKPWRSTITYGFNQIANSSGQADGVMHRAHYTSGNLFWRPFQSAEIGIEYLHGVLVEKSGASASANRIQLGVKYDLVY